jgi:CDGSH-type Zn-finger protein
MDKPTVAQKGPYEYTAEKDGKVAWCACGLSQSQPLCDGSHKPTPFRPVIHEVKSGESRNARNALAAKGFREAGGPFERGRRFFER